MFFLFSCSIEVSSLSTKRSIVHVYVKINFVTKFHNIYALHLHQLTYTSNTNRTVCVNFHILFVQKWRDKYYRIRLTRYLPFYEGIRLVFIESFINMITFSLSLFLLIKFNYLQIYGYLHIFWILIYTYLKNMKITINL